MNDAWRALSRAVISALSASGPKGFELAASLQQTLDETEPTEDQASSSDPPFQHPIARSSVGLFVDHFKATAELTSISFDRTAGAQRLLMTIAHVEAFLSESVRAICHSEPRVLATGRQLKWEEVIGAGSWDTLLDLMIERHVYQQGWQGDIAARVAAFCAAYGVELPTPHDVIEDLAQAEQARHVILHAGGRVTEEYLRKARVIAPLVSLVPMEGAFLEKVSQGARRLCDDLFYSTSAKFFPDEAADDLAMWHIAQGHEAAGSA
jgi:hypothetical protein